MPSSLSSFLNTHDVTTTAVTTYQLVQNPLIIPKSFPKIFSPQLTANGLVSPDGGDGADVKSLPMGSSLQSNSSIHNCLTSLLTAVKNINVKRLSQLIYNRNVFYYDFVGILYFLPVVWTVMGGHNCSNHYVTWQIVMLPCQLVTGAVTATKTQCVISALLFACMYMCMKDRIRAEWL